MRRASYSLSRIPRNPETTKTITTYLQKPPLAIALCLILLSLPLLLLSTLFFAISISGEKSVPALLTSFLFCYIWSAPLLLTGIGLILRPSLQRTARKIKDEDFDKQLQKDVHALWQRALHKIQINVAGLAAPAHRDNAVSAPNLWCTGQADSDKSHWGEFDDSYPSWKKGKDGQLRYRIYRVSILFLAEHHLAYYIADFNIETGLILWEETVDCHYKDVEAINFEEAQARKFDVPLWWRRFEEILEVFKVSQLLLLLMRRLMVTLSMQSDFNIRCLKIYLGGATAQFLTRITENCVPFAEDCTADPVVSKVRFLLHEKRLSIVRLNEPTATY